MGSKQSTVKNTCMEEISNINEDELDISNIDRLQIKAIKEMSERLKALEERKVIEFYIDYLFNFVIIVSSNLMG